MSMFDKFQRKNPDLFRWREGDLLSWLFENEMVTMVKCTERAWAVK